MLKKNLLLCVLFSVHFVFSQTTANLNPPYPRVAVDHFDSPVHTYSNGTKVLQLKDFDMAIMYGATQYKGNILGPILRAQNPDQIILTMAVNGMSIHDPAPFFLCSSYRAVLLEPIVPNQTTLRVSTTAELTTLYRYIRIGNDIIQVNSIPNDTTLIATGAGAEAVNQAHAAGDTVIGVYRALGQGFRPFFSEYCPSLDGDQAWDYMAKETFIDEMDWSMGLFDGIFHDYFNVELYVAGSNFDFDLNGVDDRTEHTEEWMLGQWQYGIEKLIDAENVLMNSRAPAMPNILSVNTGSSLHHFYEKLNGHMFEGYQRFTTWSYIHNDAVKWMTLGRKPSVVYFMDYISEDHFFDGKNRFSQVRFGLSHAMITEAYYGYTGGGSYLYWFWYDEYETNMGYPSGNIFTLNGAQYMLGRYFDNGVVLCNGTGMNQVISAGQLSGGPYYFLKGGQAPDFNTGEQFTGTITLTGISYGNHNLRGDGVLLFKAPTTSVADIIVDNFFMNATSPGSDAVVLAGTWRKKSAAGYEDFSRNNPFWAQSGSKTKMPISGYNIDGANGIFDENYGYHASNSGNGENTATYVPTIGVPGWYEVSEWHGWDGDTPGTVVEATNVPFEINVSGQAKIRGIINQSIDYGQWNRLGYVNLPQGKNGFVRITNKANGVVIADAMRFHYMGDHYVPDTTPPVSPKNVKVF